MSKTHITSLSIGLFLCLIATGQKSKVLSAYKSHQLYTTNKKCVELEAAKNAVDIAIQDDQTKHWAKSWYYRGNIYYDIFISSDGSCKKLSNDALNISYQAYKKALDLDQKRNYLEKIHTKLAVIGPHFLYQGVELYNAQKFGEALLTFENSCAIANLFQKIDTLALYNAALSAEKIKNYGKAQLYYEGLIEVGYGNADLYSFLSNALKSQGETGKAHEIILDGRKAFPTDQNLVIAELNYYLDNENYKSALKGLEEIIELDPSNYFFHYFQGGIFDNLKDYPNAQKSYEKAIELKPDYFDAYYNLGVLYFNRGVDMNENASNDESEASNKKRLEAVSFFEKSLPYLEKANELDSYDKSTLISLQKVYSIMGNDDGYKRVTEELEN